jgi:hypothetical protein
MAPENLADVDANLDGVGTGPHELSIQLPNAYLDPAFCGLPALGPVCGVRPLTSKNNLCIYLPKVYATTPPPPPSPCVPPGSSAPSSSLLSESVRVRVLSLRGRQQRAIGGETKGDACGGGDA